ncbi:MAG: hypothetical protein IT371_06920 [Deltaproteobacteria bacterium]|nr:hypothetical protein [Deltaproteobacteria bacterium]
MQLVRVDVLYRGIRILDGSGLRLDAEQRAFLPTASPLPVGTRLELRPGTAGDAPARTARVGAVVEQPRKGRLAEGELPGMTLLFEEALSPWRALVEELEPFPVPAASPLPPSASSTPAPAEPAVATAAHTSLTEVASPEELAELDEQAVATDWQQSKTLRGHGAPTVEMAPIPAILAAAHASDPGEVEIFEVEADLPPEESEGPGVAEAGDEEEGEPEGERGAAGETEDDRAQKKRRTRSRRKKKR